MKKNVFIALALLVMISACAPGPPVPPDNLDDIPGFFSGFWHGLTIFFSFVASLFNDDVGIYATTNSGGWYDFGFFLGVAAIFGGGASSTR